MNKLRFRQLLESTLGNVKPLIVEEEELGTTILSPTPTPILRTPVPTPTPILKTPIPTPDAYVHNECYNLLQKMVIRNLDNILDMAKEELESRGGKFPKGNPPTEDDWNVAMRRLLQNMK
jgi:hypothetical protein